MDISNRKYALGFLFLMVSLLQAVQGRAQNPGDLFVAERDLPNSCGGLFRYGRSSDGTILPRSRILISDFCNSAQGPLGVNPSDVVVDPFAANNLMLVIDPDAGANGKGILFDVRINDGQRFVLSDFGDPSQGPLGIDPTALVAVPNGGIFVLDKNNTLFPDGSASGGGRVFRL